MEKCFYSGMKKCCYNEVSRYGRKGLYEEEKSHSGIDTDSHAFATEPVQIVYAETAEATPVTSESTSVNPEDRNRDKQITLQVVPVRKLNPGWVAVEKGISMAAGRWYFTSEIGLGNDQRQEILSP